MSEPLHNPTAFRCELHMHTTFSDGYQTPEYVVRTAAERGYEVIAITDHDNTRGARAAAPIAADLGLALIPAIEFTARWDDINGPGTAQNVDILGYFIDLDDPGLKTAEQAALDDIYLRVNDCCERLTANGFPITFMDTLTANPRYGGLRQVLDVMLKRRYFATEAAARDVLDAHWAHVRLCNIALADQIAAIQAAGGVAILAHPCYYHHDGHPLESAQIDALCTMNLDGIEVYHRTINDGARTHYAALAADHNLLVSGGSDEHGWSPDLELMGREPVTRAMVEALRARHRDRVRQTHT